MNKENWKAFKNSVIISFVATIVVSCAFAFLISIIVNTFL